MYLYSILGMVHIDSEVGSCILLCSSLPGFVSLTAGGCLSTWALQLLHQGIDESQTVGSPVPEDHLPACLSKAVQGLHMHSIITCAIMLCCAVLAALGAMETSSANGVTACLFSDA